MIIYRAANIFYLIKTIPSTYPIEMFDLGTQELILIFIVAFTVFGPKKLPELGRTLGKGIRELKAAMRGVTDSFNGAEDGLTSDFKDIKSQFQNSIYDSFEPDDPEKHADSEEYDIPDTSPAKDIPASSGKSEDKTHNDEQISMDFDTGGAVNETDKDG